MLDYDLAQRGELSRYEYLYRRIRDDIVRGALDPDDRLPSKRALAQHLGVGVVTVEGAYAQLVAEGYVAARPRSGYYVRRLPQAAGQAPAVHGPTPRAGLSAPAEPSLLANLAQAQPSVRTASRLWGKALRATLAQESDDELYGPLPTRGSFRLRRAIAAHLRGSRGIEADPADVVVGAGAQVLYTLAVQLLGQGRVVAVEDPGYPRLASIYGASGAGARPLGLDDEGIRMAELRASDADMVHLMPSHQYPTGRVTSVARRYELLSWASERDERVLVEDDYDCEFRLAGRPIPALASMDALGRVLYVSTFSRGISQALRVAFMVLPAPLSALWDERLGFYSSTVSGVGQVTLARLLESGDYERHVARTRTRARATRDELLAALAACPAHDRLHVEEADSGLHLVLAAASERSEEGIAAAALEQGVRLLPLSRMAAVPEHAACPDGLRRFVVHYEGLSSQQMEQVASALARALG